VLALRLPQDFTKAVAADPNYTAAYIGRANLQRAQGNYEAAYS
jgi:Tfp pilus assembly protein PilF